MPLYEYKCPKCNHVFEKNQKVNDPKPPCPKCSAQDVEKLLGTGGNFHLKGGGWYKDGY